MTIPVSCMRKISLLLCILLISCYVIPVHAQHHENPPTSLGGRQAVMNFILPDNIKANGDFILKMILYDKTNNKNFDHVSIKLAIFKGENKKPLMNELFYDKKGEIVLDFKYKTFDKIRVVVQAQQGQFGGYMSEYGSRVKILQNIFSENGVYLLDATVISIDHPNQFLDKPIEFKKEVNIGGKEKTKQDMGKSDSKPTDTPRSNKPIEKPKSKKS